MQEVAGGIMDLPQAHQEALMAVIEGGLAALGVAGGDDVGDDAPMAPAASAPTPKRARMGLTPARMRALAGTPGSAARRAGIGGGSALSFDDAVTFGGRPSVAPGGGVPRAGGGASSSAALERDNAALRDELVRATMAGGAATRDGLRHGEKRRRRGDCAAAA
jgi:hypothetical protein